MMQVVQISCTERSHERKPNEDILLGVLRVCARFTIRIKGLPGAKIPLKADKIPVKLQTVRAHRALILIEDHFPSACYMFCWDVKCSCLKVTIVPRGPPRGISRSPRGVCLAEEMVVFFFVSLENSEAQSPQGAHMAIKKHCVNKKTTMVQMDWVCLCVLFVSTIFLRTILTFHLVLTS